MLAIFAHERAQRIDNAIELSSAYRGTALLLGDVLSSEDEYTGTHSQSVVELALVVADELHIDGEQRRLVEFGALLHDIGKITTPDDILNKAGPLDEAEWDVMRDHTSRGSGCSTASAGRCTRSASSCVRRTSATTAAATPTACRARRSRWPRGSCPSPTPTAR